MARCSYNLAALSAHIHLHIYTFYFEIKKKMDIIVSSRRKGVYCVCACDQDITQTEFNSSSKRNPNNFSFIRCSRSKNFVWLSSRHTKVKQFNYIDWNDWLKTILSCFTVIFFIHFSCVPVCVCDRVTTRDSGITNVVILCRILSK